MIRRRRDHLRRGRQPHIFLYAIQVVGNDSGETKIAKFDGAFAINQDISRLDITMDYISAVHEVESAQHIVEDGYDVRLGEGRRLCRREYALQVVLNEVHDEEYFVESLKVFDAGAR